jgi:hypothetical protein
MILIRLAFIMTLTTSLPTPNQSFIIEEAAVFFTGTTPCSNIIRQLHNIPREPDCKWNECRCMMVEWKLTLYKHPITKEPTNYKLTSINRFVIKETNMSSEPGTKAESEGRWTIVRGTKKNPEAVVYRLNPGNPEISIDMLKLGDNLLHVLDDEGSLMIGNEFYSYTLNRVAE